MDSDRRMQEMNREPIKCNSDKNEYAISFAAWELRLYLDTHPYDDRALKAYRELCDAQGEYCTYACNTGTSNGEKRVNSGSMERIGTPRCVCAQNANPVNYACPDKAGRVWHWIDDPWPWEIAANMNLGGR